MDKNKSIQTPEGRKPTGTETNSVKPSQTPPVPKRPKEDGDEH